MSLDYRECCATVSDRELHAPYCHQVTDQARYTEAGWARRPIPVEHPEGSIDAELAKIEAWWHDHANATISRTAPKAVEYGAADLDIMGAAMLKILPVPDEMTYEERMEIGRYAACAFYALGKIGRIMSALEQGRLPGPDSEFDLEVYAVMMARVREIGRWV